MLIFAAQSLVAQRNSEVIEYINAYKEIAIREMIRSGVPASITLAQGIHESMAGKSVLVQKSKNHFGIKCRAEWKGEKVYHDDDARGECFRSYTNAEQSYVDHSDFLKNGTRYAFLFAYEPTNYSDWANGLKKAGYATNPKYAQIIIKYIEDYNLQQYTLIALGKVAPKDEILAGNGKPVNVSISNGVAIQEIVLPTTAKPAVSYPNGKFTINRTKVIFATAGTSLLGLAKEHDISLKHLLDFNEMGKNSYDILAKDQLIYLQRKRRSGDVEYHEVKPGETLYDIAQHEGMRYENLVSYNHLQELGEPAIGEKLYLQGKAPVRPRLAKEVPVVVVVETPKATLPVATTPAPVTQVITQPATTPVSPVAANAILHPVQEKETLYSISKKYNITIEQIKEWNKLTSNDLKIGQELVIYKN